MSVCEALEELMHDELEESRKRGWDDGQKAGWGNRGKEDIMKMLKNGFSPEKIAQILEIPLKDVLAVK